MSQYTEILDIEAETLSPDDDGYEESLLEIATLFRGFNEAFTAFIVEHGYADELSDVEAKAKFLREKYKAAGVKPPRDFKEWFAPNKRLKRETVFPICFAFNLGISETNDFFRCVQFERSFDCHTINEAVYYFCLKNGLSYSDAKEIISRIPNLQKVKAIPDREVLYTGTIIEYINNIDDKEKLIQYITDNINDFEYNNVTAIEYTQQFWAKISGEAESQEESDEYNLAAKEGKIIEKAYNRFQDKSRKGDTDTRSKEVIDEDVKREEEVKLDDLVVAEEGASTWTIFSQIIGLDNMTERKYAATRSISDVLNKNALLPLNASYCFPSRQSIDNLVRGKCDCENESIRKVLILLVFYTYWAKKIINSKDAFYSARRADAEGCLDTINNYLLGAGYPQLYAGNPYDWLFKWSLNDDYPLDAFRWYMKEVFNIEEGQAESNG
uniref:hypothetical protein n=1 Tax=Agathobacter sp. TaxID=2021311 RepID=UPI004055EF87